MNTLLLIRLIKYLKSSSNVQFLILSIKWINYLKYINISYLFQIKELIWSILEPHGLITDRAIIYLLLFIKWNAILMIWVLAIHKVYQNLMFIIKLIAFLALLSCLLLKPPINKLGHINCIIYLIVKIPSIIKFLIKG